MANSTKYSRLVFKRSTVAGVTPTIPTGTTIDSSWLSTDILIGEGFINVIDDRFWFRTDNGIVEVALSGNSMYRYTTGATLVDNTIFFNRTDALSAYSVDLSSITVSGGTSGDYLPLTVTGTTYVDVNDNALYFTGNSASSITTVIVGGSGGDQAQATQVTDDYAALISQDIGNQDYYYVKADQSVGASLEYSTGATVNLFKVTKSTMQASSTISGFNGITYGADYSANYTNRSLVDKEYVDGVALSGLTLDYLPLSGGILTGDLNVAASFSARTMNILNSGATTVNVSDYSSNTIRTGVTNSAIIGGSGNTINANLRNVFVAGVNLTATTSDSAYFSTAYSNGINVNACDLSFAISDESTAITTGTSKLTIYAPYGLTITSVKASLSTSGSSLTEFDVNVNGSSIFSRRPTIDANEFHSDDATAGQPIISSATVTYKDKITIDIDQAGTGAKGAKIYILGNRTS